MLEARSHVGSSFLVRKLKSFAVLSPGDEAALLSLPIEVMAYPAHHDLIQEGDEVSVCHLILDGFASRHKSLSDGRRQILSFQTPGDLPDLQGLHLETMDYSVQTLSPTTVGRISHVSLRGLAAERPGVNQALRRDAAIDGAIFREWIVGLGRRSVREHLAHMLCETAVRLRSVGLPAEMPVDKTVLAEALGQPTVQVTRELQLLRREGLVESRADTLAVLDYENLARLCDFDPGYLRRSPGA